MKPQITPLFIDEANDIVKLQRSCGMKPQITLRPSLLVTPLFPASKELRHEAADHVRGFKSAAMVLRLLQRSCGMKPQITGCTT